MGKVLHISKGVRWQGNVSRTEIIRGGNALKIGVVGRWERTLQRDVCLVILTFHRLQVRKNFRSLTKYTENITSL